jgi:hypothetical protein
MKRSRSVAILLAVVALVSLVANAAAMYTWVDETGTEHIASRIEDVPDRYRSKAKPLAYPSPPVHESCATVPTDPAGGARVRFSLERSHLIVIGCINGKGPYRLLLDTGWPPPSMVQPRVLDELGIDIKKAGFMKDFYQGQGKGKRELVVTVRSIQVGGARMGPLDVGTFSLSSDFDGVLGQDFMSLFVLEIDNRRGVLTLTPR